MFPLQGELRSQPVPAAHHGPLHRSAHDRENTAFSCLLHTARCQPTHNGGSGAPESILKKRSEKRQVQVYHICDGVGDSLHHPQLGLLVRARTSAAPEVGGMAESLAGLVNSCLFIP